MEKVNLKKKYIVRIILIFMLLASIFSCIYAVYNYKGNNNTIIQNNNMFKRDGSMAQPNGSVESNEIGNTQSDSNKNKQRGNNRNIQQDKSNGNMQMGGVDAKYLPQITIYSIIFLILSCGIYFLIRRKKVSLNSRDEKFLIFTLLAVGFFLRISASTLINGHNDINLFKNWAETAAKGFSEFYVNARQADYPPLYIYILGIIGKIVSIFDLNSYYVLMLKIPSIVADVITSYLIYKLSKKHLNLTISIFLTAFYIFNPAVFIDSTFWGQVDSLFTLLIVIAIYLLFEKKYTFSSVVFSAAALMKPQGIIFLPILFFELVRQRKVKNFIYAAFSAIITMLIIIIPFSLNQQNPLWIFELYSKTISEYPYASVNAFNFYSLIGANYKNYDTALFILNYHTIGMIFIVITTLIGWFVYIKGNDRKYISAIALLQIAGVFTFSVGMHERYLFPAVALSILAFIYLKDRRFFMMAVGFSITSYINISIVFFKTNILIFNIFLRITSLLNVIIVLYLVKTIIDNSIKKILLEIEDKESEAL